MKWILLFIIILVVLVSIRLLGEFIHIGNPWGDNEDYMIGDDENDWGDKT